MSTMMTTVNTQVAQSSQTWYKTGRCRAQSMTTKTGSGRMKNPVMPMYPYMLNFSWLGRRAAVRTQAIT